MAVDLDAQRARVARALRGAMRANAGTRSRLLGVGGDALAAATAANRAVATSATRPAIERYTGVLYDALDHATLPAGARRRLPSVLVVSGLWGLVGPADPIPDYKLKMGASLGRFGRLATWWRGPVSERAQERADGATVWNLLPQEHAAAVDLGDRRQLSVTFLEPNTRGELVAVSHWNKSLKGALVRHLLEHPTTDPDDLADWDHPAGYRLDPSRTVEEGPRVRLAMVRAG